GKPGQRSHARGLCFGRGSLVVYRHGVLIYVYLIAVILFQFGNVTRGIFRVALAVLRHHVDQRSLYILRHPQRVTAHIYMLTALHPCAQVAAFVAHAVLNIDLLVTIARPSEGQPTEMAGPAHRFQLVLVEEVKVAALMAKIEPVGPGRPRGKALLKERAERRDAGAGPDHDDRLAGIGGKRKMLRLLNIDPDPVAGRN